MSIVSGSQVTFGPAALLAFFDRQVTLNALVVHKLILSQISSYAKRAHQYRREIGLPALVVFFRLSVASVISPWMSGMWWPVLNALLSAGITDLH